jgi:hypothetical protein
MNALAAVVIGLAPALVILVVALFACIDRDLARLPSSARTPSACDRRCAWPPAAHYRRSRGGCTHGA